jgi:hypothetical protein
MMADCIATDINCAQICRLAAGFMARGSSMAMEVCRLCAGICDVCAEECEKHEHPHCKECARACRSCAEECRSMAA